MNKISAVYKIVNTITGECYVGSSKDVKERWDRHKCPSRWDSHPNVTLYQGMQKYGVENFRFQILAPVMPEHLKQVEQELIDLIEPEYNTNRANGQKKHHCRYNQNYHKNYGGQICEYNGETLTLKALLRRFQKAGVEHPAIEAKKYLKNS